MHDPFNTDENHGNQEAPTEDEPHVVSDGEASGAVNEPFPSDFGSSDSPSTEESADMSDWKTELRDEIDKWLETIEDVDKEDEPEPETPDLYTFYETLATLTSESRKSNRRTAEALSQWTDLLKHSQADLAHVRTQLLAFESKTQSLPRTHCLALIELCDRVERLAAAFRSPPKASWWRRDSDWKQTWERQRQGFDILRDHLGALLKKEGIARMGVVGTAFDPVTMSAAATESSADRPHYLVIEEIAAGYRQGDEVLRLAQVKVNLKPAD